MKSVNAGAELFHELIETNSYCIEKTPFIKTVCKDNISKVMLITRTRRFGKPLTMSTFYDFFTESRKSLRCIPPGMIQGSRNL